MQAALREFGLTPQRVEVPPCNLRAWLGRVEPGVTEAEYLVVHHRPLRRRAWRPLV